MARGHPRIQAEDDCPELENMALCIVGGYQRGLGIGAASKAAPLARPDEAPDFALVVARGEGLRCGERTALSRGDCSELRNSWHDQMVSDTAPPWTASASIVD